MPNLPSTGQIIGYIVAGYIVILLLDILKFLLIRQFVCWYLRINERLREQERTNELLQNIFDALIQGNAVSSISAERLVNLQTTKQGSPTMIRDDDIPEL